MRTVCSLISFLFFAETKNNGPFAILKFILGSEAWASKTKEMYYSLLSLEIIPQASQPSMNFNISELVYWFF